MPLSHLSGLRVLPLAPSSTRNTCQTRWDLLLDVAMPYGPAQWLLDAVIFKAGETYFEWVLPISFVTCTCPFKLRQLGFFQILYFYFVEMYISPYEEKYELSLGDFFKSSPAVQYLTCISKKFFNATIISTLIFSPPCLLSVSSFAHINWTLWRRSWCLCSRWLFI